MIIKFDKKVWQKNWINPKGSYSLFMKDNKTYIYLYLSESSNAYIKLNEKFCRFYDDFETIVISLNLLWDNINVYQKVGDETFNIGTYNTKTLYNKFMKNDWKIRWSQKGRLDE